MRMSIAIGASLLGLMLAATFVGVAQGQFRPMSQQAPRAQQSRQSYNPEYIRPPSQNNDAAVIAGGILGIINNAIQQQPPRPPQNYPPQYYPPQNYPPQNYYPPQQPQQTVVAPPKNVVAPKKPPKNAAFRLNNANLQLMSAELDARQSAEAAKAGGKLDAALEEAVNSAAVPPALKQEMNEAWAKAVTSGDPQKFEEFKAKYGGNLPPNAQKMLDTRIELANYGADLEAGKLTFSQKEARLEQINNMVNGLGPSILQDGLKDNLSQMEKLNNLGNLVDLTQGTSDPLQIITVGVTDAGMPPGFIADISGLPIMVTDPVSDSTVAIRDILLFNDSKNDQAVNYQIGANAYAMQPGEKQALSRPSLVAFQTRQDGAVKQYQVAKGVFRFILGADGWDLKQVIPQLTIDNSEYNGAFKYLVNGQEVSLEAGAMKEHSGDKAFLVEFDRGDGKTSRKVIPTGSFRVGISASDSMLDLFEIEPVSADDLASESGVTPRANRAPPSKAKQIEEALARLKAKKG